MTPLVDIMDEIVRRVNAAVIDQIKAECKGIYGINYMHGHWKEVSGRLVDMGKNPKTAKNKFPLVVLLEDFPFDYTTKNPTGTVQVLICAVTNKNYNSDERQAKIFNPILDPIYWELLNQMAKSGYFAQTYYLKFPHKKWDRKAFGKEDPYGNSANIPLEYLDVVQMQNLQLILNRNVC